MDNELAALDIPGEVPAIDETIEEITEQQPAEEQPAEEQPAEETQEGAEAEVVDEEPSPEKLKLEIQQLEEQKEKAKKDALLWRKQKAVWRKEARYEERNAGREREPAAPVRTPRPAASIPEPKQDDFDTYEEYIDARTDYKVKVARAEWEAEAEEKAADEEYQQRQATFQEKLGRGYEKYDDFEDVALAETVPITPLIRDIMAESDIPEDIAYYLGKNRTEAVRIGRLQPFAAAKEIAKIELKLNNTPLTKTAKTKKKVTTAPAPITPITTAGKTGEKDPEDMTQAEFEKWREEQGAPRY